MADRVGVSKQGLYKLLSENGNPRLATLREVLGGLGMKIRIEKG